MKPITASVLIDELVAAKTRVAELTEKVVASLTEAAGKLGYALVPGGAHPLTDGPISMTTANEPIIAARSRLTRRERDAVIYADGFNLKDTKKTKPAPLKCKICPRTFALPLHLGRHMHATHPKNNSMPRSRRGR